jgi:hypothetical protein
MDLQDAIAVLTKLMLHMEHGSNNPKTEAVSSVERTSSR